MAKKCDFCLIKLKANEGFCVKEIVIDKNPGIIKLTDVLLDLFFCELNVTNICQECMDTVSKQFIFKQKIRKNIQMPSSNVFVQISKFFSKTQETISTSEHLDVLSVFPESRKKFVETIQKFSPEICIKPPIIKEVLPTESVSVSSKKEASTSKKIAESSTSGTETNDSNYAVNKSSRKRKKKSVKARNSNANKKQKNNSVDSIVKDESVTEINDQATEFEFFTCDQNDTIFRKKRSRELFNTSRLNLTKEQEIWLKETMESTERNGFNYICKFCFKDLKSNTAMCYHYANRHLLKQLTKKQVWVAHKVKEGIIEVNDNGIKMTKWKCTECSKIYNNQPAIRYHLSKHLMEDFDEIFELSTVKN